MKKLSFPFAVFAFAGFLAFPVLAAENAPGALSKNPVSDSKPAVLNAPAVSQAGPVAETSPAQPAKPILPVPATTLSPAKPVPPVPAKPEPAVKMGFVDMVKIANESAPGKAAYADLKARSGKFKSQIEAKKKQLEKERADIEAKLQTLTPQQRNTKAKQFQKKLEDLQKFAEKGQKELQNREADLLGKLYKSIEKSAGDYGKANGLAAIVTKKDLLYLDEKVDIKEITAEIIKLVDAGQAKK